MMVLNQDISGITDSVSMVMNQAVKARELAEVIKENGQELGDAIENAAMSLLPLSRGWREKLRN